MKHISEHIPAPFLTAHSLSLSLKYRKGQSHFLATKEICRLLKEGLKQ